MLLDICPSTLRTPKFFHTYVITYGDFMAILEPCPIKASMKVVGSILPALVATSSTHRHESHLPLLQIKVIIIRLVVFLSCNIRSHLKLTFG